MRLFILFFMLIIGCKQTSSNHCNLLTIDTIQIKDTYPIVVYNKCIDKWAVRLGVEHFGFMEKSDTLYFGKVTSLRYIRYIIDRDVVKDVIDSGKAYLGYEFQYPDSSSAIISYKNWKERSDMINKQFNDSIENSYHRLDSIYKCNHTYY